LYEGSNVCAGAEEHEFNGERRPFRFDLAEFGLAEFFDPQKGSPPKLPEKIRHGKKA
jgi:hypothetical protein